MKKRDSPTNRVGRVVVALAAAVVVGLAAQPVHAQVTPAAGYTPPDDTPSVKVGAVIFADYPYQQKPSTTDADGNSIKSNSFNVSRAYVNVTGNVSHLVAFRVTPDVTRMTSSGTGVSTSLDGSLTFRLKYAFAQINLDDWLPKGSYVRLGIQQTPYVDFVEGIYRYRFQGTFFEEREGYLSSSDAGVSFHAQFPQNRGDLHVGLYNGEDYNKAEANDQKAIMIRASFRPLPMHPVLRGWRVTGFYVGDNYIKNAERKRGIVGTTFEHEYLVAGFDYLVTRDLPSARTGSKDLHGRGWSVFATPRLPKPANGSAWEALLRYDRLTPNDEVAVVGGATAPGAGVNKRAIAGISYWFPKQGSVSAALMFDVENVTFSAYPPAPARPTQQRLFLHSLVSF